MADCKAYFDAAEKVLAQEKEKQRENIYQAADMIGQAMVKNGIVQLVGFGHDMEFSMELGYRAGGLMPFHRWADKDLPMKGLISPEQFNAEDFRSHTEYMQLLWDVYHIDSQDLFLVTCANGADTFAIEVARLAHSRGHKVIAVISGPQVAAAKEKAKLTEYADLILDTGVAYPDELVKVGPYKLCPVQTLAGNVIAQMLTAEMYRWFEKQHLQCPVLLSANVTGADVHNREISDKYLGRWNA
jgi:uncharacterized phosphosugar-binding protein